MKIVPVLALGVFLSRRPNQQTLDATTITQPSFIFFFARLLYENTEKRPRYAKVIRSLTLCLDKKNEILVEPLLLFPSQFAPSRRTPFVFTSVHIASKYIYTTSREFSLPRLCLIRCCLEPRLWFNFHLLCAPTNVKYNYYRYEKKTKRKKKEAFLLGLLTPLKR